jgi:uncharacterized membrane protein
VDKVVNDPALVVHELMSDPQKIRTMAYLFVPFLLLVLYSPLVLLCVPLVLQQLLSTVPDFWGMRFHYWLPIATVLAMGAADGARNLLRLLHREHSAGWVGAILGALMVYANLHIAKKFPVWQVTRPEFSFARTADERDAYRALKVVPHDASVITQAPLLPHLSTRRDIYLLGSSPALPAAKYLVLNPAVNGWPDPATEQAWLDRHRSQYRRIAASGSWWVYRRT